MARSDLELVYSIKPESTRQNKRQIEKDIGGLNQQLVRKNFKQPLGEIRGELGEFQKSMAASNARVLAFGASTAVIAGVATALRGVARASIDVEKSLADINVILNESSKGLDKFGSELFKIAANTGQSFKVVADAAGELARQGLGIEETLKRTSDALILARLSGMDTVDAVNSLTAAVNSFSKSALTSTEIVNKLANVDAAFAVSSADLAEAIKRVGSSASDAGVSMDQLIAIVTTAQQTTARGGAVIGNSFKTIFTRLQRPAVLDQLASLGIATKDAQGNIMPLIGVLQGLAKSFDTLEDTQKSQIAELVGGVFQVNVLKAALSDLSNEYGTFARAQDISASSTNEAIKRNEELNKTLSSLINRTFVNLQNVGAQVGDIGFAPQARGILETINKGLEGAGGLKTGEDLGNRLGRGVIKGLGDFFLGGPGLLLGALGIYKLFKQLGKFSIDAFKGITELDKGAQRRANTEARINQLLMNDKELLNRITNENLDAATAADLVYKAYLKQDAVLTKIQSKVKSASSPLSFTKLGNKAGGFIPNFSGSTQERLAMMASGYNPSDVRNARVRKTTIHDGRGGSFRSFVNSKETVSTGTNAAGYRATFVVPPKSSAAYGNYIKNIPNFAKTLGPDDFAKVPGATSLKQVLKGLGLPNYRVSMKASEANFKSFSGLSSGQKSSFVKAKPKPFKGEIKTVSDVFKKYGVKGPLNVSALAFSEMGPQAGGALNMVGSPFDARRFQSSFEQNYPSFLTRVGSYSLNKSKISGRPKLDGALSASLVRSIERIASDPNASAQVRGRVFETLSAALLKDHTKVGLGSQKVDLSKGGGIQTRYLKTGLVSPAFDKALRESGVELKAGSFRLFGKNKGILRKLAPKGTKIKDFEADLRSVIPSGDPFRESIFGSSASGFVPNFSPVSRAMRTERSMGGNPEFRAFPFPHVADKSRQKNFGDVMRDHPEGIGKAIKNSFAAQGVPNFAPFGLGGLGKSLGMGKSFLAGTLALEQASAAFEKLSKTLGVLENSVHRNRGELEAFERAVKSGKVEDFEALGYDAKTLKTKGTTKTDVDKRSKEFKEVQKKLIQRQKNASKLEDEFNRVKGERVKAEKELAKQEKRRARSEKIGQAAFSAAFLLPTIGNTIMEGLDLEPLDKALGSDLVNAASTAGTALSILGTGPAGLAAAALFALGGAAGAVTNRIANVGDGLAKAVEELKKTNQDLQDASAKYFDVSSQLDEAVKSGASGEIIARLNSRLAETLGKLEPEQQALLLSSKTLKEKQLEMGRIIEEQGKVLKQTQLAKSIADSINDARGMGITSFFQGLGSVMTGGTFRQGANDVNAITGDNVGGFASSLLSNVGPDLLRSQLRTGGFSSGNFLGMLSDTGKVSDELIKSLKELNSDGLNAVRLTVQRLTLESERNIAVTTQLTNVQKQYNALIASATKIQNDAADALIATQRRLVDNFVFEREFKANDIFNTIDLNIKKFDNLFGATAQNLDAFQKADLQFQRSKLDAEIAFQKSALSVQNKFLNATTESAAIATGINISPTAKKAQGRRGVSQVTASREFTDALKQFGQDKDLGAFNSRIVNLIGKIPENIEKNLAKQGTTLNELTQEVKTSRQELKQQTRIAELQRDFDKQQARQLISGGIKALIEPASFEQMSSKMADAMEDIFIGRGGIRGALGVNDIQAGGGFLSLVSQLREQGANTEAIAKNNPALRAAAIRGRASQIRSQGQDLAFFGAATGDSATNRLGLTLIQEANKIAEEQVDAALKGDEKLEKILNEIQTLVALQGEQTGTTLKAIEKLLDTNTKSQKQTFDNLDSAAKKLEAASFNLDTFTKLRQFDPSDDLAIAQAARRKQEDEEKNIAEILGLAASRGLTAGMQSQMGFAGMFQDPAAEARFIKAMFSSNAELIKQIDASIARGDANISGFRANVFKNVFSDEGLRALDDARRTARGGKGLNNLATFSDMTDAEKRSFANTFLSSLTSLGKGPADPESRKIVLEGLTEGPFSFENIFNNLINSNDAMVKTLNAAMGGRREAILEQRRAGEQAKKDVAKQAEIRENRIREQEARNLNPITGILNDRAIENAERGLGKTAANLNQNMFTISENIFKAASALNEKETPFVTAAKEIAQASQAGFHVTIDDTNFSMDENTVDVIANKTAEKINNALGQIASSFTNFTGMIDIIKEGLPDKVQRKINTYQTVGSNIIANQKAFNEAKKQGFK